MRFALEVWSSDFDALLATCQQAEALGFDAVYYGESPHGLNLDCWTALAALSRATDTIRLGPVITNLLPDYRSLALLGKQAATTAVVAGGRLDFRTGAGAAGTFGRGWWQPFAVDYPNYDDRLAMLAQALPLLRRYWAGAPVEFDSGASVTLGFDCPPIALTVAATGTRAMTVAGAWADVWETSWQTPAEYAERLSRFTRSSDGRAVIHSLEVDAFTAHDSVGVECTLAEVQGQRGLDDEALQTLMERSLIGTPEAVGQRIHAYADAGVDQLLIALHEPHDAGALDALAAGVRAFRLVAGR